MLAKFVFEVHVSHSLRDVLGVRRVVPNVERAINLLIIPSAPKRSTFIAMLAHVAYANDIRLKSSWSDG